MPQLTSGKGFASVADWAACRAMLRGGSRTFFAASMLLPGRVRVPSIGLYAFCRMADDAIDQGVDRRAAMRGLRRRLDAIYASTPENICADRAFADSVRLHGIPKAFPSALLEGFEWDCHGRRYEDLSELTAYGVRVAGTVGAMMAMIMGVRQRALIARACDLGVAMQMTNIARDVGEDARAGRLYLPRQWLRAENIDPEAWLAAPVFNPQIRRVVERLLRAAAVLYVRADAGLAALPPSCRPGMYAARLLYAEIGNELARRGYDSVSQRTVVPWQVKTRVLWDALRKSNRSAAASAPESLEEAAFILGSLQEPADFRPQTPATWPRIEDRVEWLVDLFERLERREHAA